MWVQPTIVQSLYTCHSVCQALVYHEKVIDIVMASGQLRGKDDAINHLEPAGAGQHLRRDVPVACCNPRAFECIEAGSPSTSFRYTFKVYSPPLSTASTHATCNLCLIALGMSCSGAGAIPVPALVKMAPPPEPMC